MSKLLCIGHGATAEKIMASPYGKRVGEFAKHFDKVYILCSGSKKIIKKNKTTFLQGNLFSWFSYYKKVKDCDKVYASNFFNRGFLGLKFSKLLGKPLYLRVGGVWKYKIDSPAKLFKKILVSIIKPLVLKNCDKVVYNSKAIVSNIKHKHSIVYNGVDTKLFKPMKAKSFSGKINILFIGRLYKEKGLLYLFEAVKDMKDIKLGIAGTGPLKNKLEKYNLAHFFGDTKHEQLPKLINSFDCIILPSLDESFPNSLLEAMSCGKPIIGTKVGGIPEMIKHGYNGLLIPEKDSSAIKQALLKLRDKKLRLKLGKNARKTVLERFENKKQLEKLYKSLFT